MVPSRVRAWQGNKQLILAPEDVVPESLIPATKRKRKRVRGILFFIWLLLLGLYVQSYFGFGKPLLPTHISVKILLRSVIVVLAWLFLVGPLVKMILHRWLQKKRDQSRDEIAKILDLLPSTQQLIIRAWKNSDRYKGLRRVKEVTKLIFTNALLETKKQEVYILTDKIQTGKTTSIKKWAARRNDVFGVLTPVIDGKRVFMDLVTGEQFPMEAVTGEAKYEVGRFQFSRKNFERAKALILKSVNERGWLILDA